MYVCGPTVYDEPHVGHARSAYIFDVIRRYLIYKGYKVRFARNVTDVDDKIIDKAAKEFPGEDLKKACEGVADKYLKSYHEALKELSIDIGREVILEPKASDYIPKMADFIQDLIKRGVAYPSGGDVYFDITKAKNYGKLSNQAPDRMEAGSRVSPTENKRDPLDFALWKSAKENEPSWDSPWGKGRPGWHIECSVMSSDVLGDEFDIHGGGIDLIFPHHENEIAQSEGAGKKFARFWVHHGLLTINGQKMAKSLGNFITIKDVLNKYPADVLKIFYLQAHYSSPIDFTWERLEATKSAYKSIVILREKLQKEYGTVDITEVVRGGAGAMLQFKNKFIESMDDDFNTPKALAVLFDMINRCNIELDGNNKDKDYKLRYALDIMKEMTEVFGLSFLYESSGVLSDNEVEFQIVARLNFKKQKDFTAADSIRKRLEEQGIILEDTKDGKTTWRRKL